MKYAVSRRKGPLDTLDDVLDILRYTDCPFADQSVIVRGYFIALKFKERESARFAGLVIARISQLGSAL